MFTISVRINMEMKITDFTDLDMKTSVRYLVVYAAFLAKLQNKAKCNISGRLSQWIMRN